MYLPDRIDAPGENLPDPKSLTLVLMAGLPGAGKTTLAYALGREFQWQVVDKDRSREVLLRENLDVDRASKIAYEISFDTVKTVLLQQKLSVILDTAALHRFILDTAQEMAATTQARLKVILCVADRDLRNQRLRNRKSQSTRIHVDPETIPDYLYHFRHLPPDTLILYTSNPYEECFIRARAYLMNGPQEELS